MYTYKYHITWGASQGLEEQAKNKAQPEFIYIYNAYTYMHVYI